MIYPALLCAFAGLSTALGGIIVIVFGVADNKKMSFSQGFAAGVMLAVSIFDLLPESYGGYYEYMPAMTAFRAVMSLFFCGRVIGCAISGVVPPGEKDEGDSHIGTVKRTALITTAVMVLHNLPEGVLTMFTSSRDISFGARMAIAVALHNIPEGMAIASPVLYVTNSKSKAFFQTFWAGMAELFGGVGAYVLLRGFITREFLNGLMPLIAGIMCRAAIFELIPAGIKISKIEHTMYGILSGVALITIGLIVF